MIVKRKFKWGKISYHSISGKLEVQWKGKTYINKDAYRLLSEMMFPFKTKYILTAKCNHECYYCFVSEEKHGARSLSTKAAFSIIDKMANAGTFLVELFGGEPFMRKDFFEILDYLLHKKIIVSIFTNGTLINKEKLDQLSRYPNINLISVTLFSMNQNIHDKLTGCSGSFLRTMRFLDSSKQLNIPIRCSLTVTRLNLHEVMDVIDYVAKNKFEFAFGYGIFPYEGKDKPEYQDVELSANDLAKLYGQIQKKYPNFLSKNTVPSCSGGRHGYTIDTEGYLIACSSVPLRYGDLNNSALKDIHNRNSVSAIKETYFTIPPKCFDCEASRYCAESFCPAVSKMLGGTNELPASAFCEKAFAILKQLKESS